MAQARTRGGEQQEVFESRGAARAPPGPLLRPAPLRDENLSSAPPLDLAASRARFAEFAAVASESGGENTTLARWTRLRAEAALLLAEQSLLPPHPHHALPVAALAELRALHEKLQRGLESRFDESGASELPGGFLAAPRREASAQSVQQVLSSSDVIYEVYGTPGLQIAPLERRLASLESAVGRDDAGHASLRAEIGRVREQLRLLNPESLKSNAELMQSLLDASKRLPDKDDQGVSGERARVREAAALLLRMEQSVAALPSVANRLQQLHSLHESAARLVERVSALEREQAAVSQLLADGRALLASALASTDASQKACEASCAALLKRLEAMAP